MCDLFWFKIDKLWTFKPSPSPTKTRLAASSSPTECTVFMGLPHLLLLRGLLWMCTKSICYVEEPMTKYLGLEEHYIPPTLHYARLRIEELADRSMVQCQDRQKKKQKKRPIKLEKKFWIEHSEQRREESSSIEIASVLARIVVFKASNSSDVGSTSVERSTYIVHMDKSLMPKDFTSHHDWYYSTVDSLKPTIPIVTTTSSQYSKTPPRLIYTYNNVAHGFCALLSQDELEILKKSLGFISAYNDKQIKLCITHTPEFLSLNPSTALWPASDYEKDVIVGFVDTGVWSESLSFRDDGMRTSPILAKWKGKCEVRQEFNASMCNSKLIGARYFNKGLGLILPSA
ncbi:hypothetical protein HYC85_004081 [Camellia sinensis]|uniref:Inhibitor I9 domain-containing protein n=1 Tax=Camellia sinensis TaxID=4442 RepID=A0A7J7HXK3_CAMSI|nr:hypothetical protein HYC85_004081 [Camellia sinensis]